MSQGVPEVASEVDVGRRLRDIRIARRRTLREVSDAAGLSESFLSQVERGRASASIASLRRIAGALGVSIADLFQPAGPGQPRVVRRHERPSLDFGVLGRKTLLTQRPLHNLEVFVGELEPGGSSGAEPYTHGDSEELVVVIAGSVRLELGRDVHRLEEGDSIGYWSSTPHRIENVGDDVAEVMWIISPPSY